MVKKNTKKNRSRRRSSAPSGQNIAFSDEVLANVRVSQVPEDVIALMQDDELFESLRTAAARLETAWKMFNPSLCKSWEEEICYLQREIQLRKDRRQEHQKYLRLEDLAMRRERDTEHMLPAADLDNSRFFILN